ncbi:cation diffusion facilitator family transporter [Nosocomiicoccus ampullae]|uniref:Cation diffusion facilitator family transporter n=1 Tax=Nosocomiicoccus ampullae TaxID=489910 RepID=A0A9Q2CXR9_9STAP|nr:cation diffusion facilitator family transporter [Nosocomiicoccus ampullae]MBB5175150.1 cation diffusion facilitator family transporter [Nosocomiicoccus ampullae]QYA46470.1 cation diffusion facilitator family transporter [Nosocomiicoccus ampullae]
MKSINKNIKKARLGAVLSIVTYIFLTLVKITFGFLDQSDALIADGLNNFTDVIGSTALFIGLTIALIPRDDNHTYGHYRAELIAALIASFIMFAVGIQVIIQTVIKFINNDYAEPSTTSLYISIFSMIIMLIVAFINFRLANKVSSVALKAASFDNLQDGLVSLGAAIGIIGVLIGFETLDTIASFLIGILIIYTAVIIFKETATTLTDGFNSKTLKEMEEIIQNVSGVIDVVDIKGRSHGFIYFVDVTVTVNPKLNVVEGHMITERIERAMSDAFGDTETIVHIEPALFS